MIKKGLSLDQLEKIILKQQETLSDQDELINGLHQYISWLNEQLSQEVKHSNTPGTFIIIPLKPDPWCKATEKDWYHYFKACQAAGLQIDYRTIANLAYVGYQTIKNRFPEIAREEDDS